MIKAVQVTNRAIEQTASMQTDKPNFTEWTERPPFQLDDDNDEDDTLDRL